MKNLPRFLAAPWLLLIILPSAAFSQPTSKSIHNQTMRYSELATLLRTVSVDSLLFDNVMFEGDLPKRDWSDGIFEDDYIVSAPLPGSSVKTLQFYDCHFSTSVFFEGEFNGDLIIYKCEGPEEFIINRSTIKRLYVLASTFPKLIVERSTFTDLTVDQSTLDIGLYRTTVKGGKIEIACNRNLHIGYSRFLLTGRSLIEGKMEGSIGIDSCVFAQIDSGYVQFERENGYIELFQNRFDDEVDFYGSGDKVTWNFIDNTFAKGVGFRTMAEIGPASFINFRDLFSHRPLGWHARENGRTIFFDGSDNQVAGERPYKNLLRLHKRLHSFYLEGGDLESANMVYVHMKDLETKRLSYEYHNDPSVDHWLRIRLNHLLKFYTRYNTDPARAIAMSVWVIVAFAVFYMIFPSAFDTERRATWMNRLKNALAHNGKARIRHMWRLIPATTVVFLEAFVLSVNAFVTLGFGEIPSRGVARYLTVIEGLLGWFLLTLFSVALISQSVF